MNVKKALDWGIKKLIELENPRLEAEVLLSNLLNKDRTWLRTHCGDQLKWWQCLRFFYFIWQRQRHVPVAYILGYTDWNGIRIKVNRLVLIPRDETEILCHHVKSEVRKSSLPPSFSILDIGTGSGCIALWLKQEFPEATVVAVDISSSVLKVAQSNAYQAGLNVQFRRSDLLSNISQSYFDVIVANLPYVPENHSVSLDLSYEPAGAIFSGGAGLGHIRKLAKQLSDEKLKYQQLWLEFLPSQKNEIKKIFNSKRVKFFTDIGGDIFFAKISQ
jgi:release factor glutamine methyltransferase